MISIQQSPHQLLPKSSNSRGKQRTSKKHVNDDDEFEFDPDGDEDSVVVSITNINSDDDLEGDGLDKIPLGMNDKELADLYDSEVSPSYNRRQL